MKRCLDPVLLRVWAVALAAAAAFAVQVGPWSRTADAAAQTAAPALRANAIGTLTWPLLALRGRDDATPVQ